MTTLTVQGRLDSAPANTDLAKQTSPDLVVTPKYSPQLQIARAGVPLHTLEVSDDDVVELDLGGGIRLWMRVDQLQEDLNPTFRRSVTAPAFVVPSTLPLGSPRRGVCLAFRKPLNQSRGIQRLPADLERIREPLIETHERPQEPLHTAPQHWANSPPGEPVYQALFDFRSLPL